MFTARAGTNAGGERNGESDEQGNTEKRHGEKVERHSDSHKVRCCTLSGQGLLSCLVTIRQRPSDFIVEEVINQGVVSGLRTSWSAEARHAAFVVTKESLTTPAAAGMLAQRLGVRIGDVEYAGLKDKHARTTQWMTALLRESPGAIATELATSGTVATFRGFLARHVDASDIAHNAFRIAVRDISQRACDQLEHRTRLLRIVEPMPQPTPHEQPPATEYQHPHHDRPATTLLVPNYFGDQRFASLRKGQFAAKHLIAGDFEAALRLLIATPLRKQSGAAKTATRLCADHWGSWSLLLDHLQKSPARDAVAVLARNGSFREAFEALPHLDKLMAVESLQSHIWNATASRCVRRHAARGWLEASPTVDLAFTYAADVPERLRQARVPMPSPHLPAAASDADLWSEDLHAALDAEQLTLEQLTIPGVRKPAFDHFDRPMFVEARSFAMSPPSGTQRLDVHLQFHLPSGAYATNVLRALGQ